MNHDTGAARRRVGLAALALVLGWAHVRLGEVWIESLVRRPVAAHLAAPMQRIVELLPAAHAGTPSLETAPASELPGLVPTPVARTADTRIPPRDQKRPQGVPAAVRSRGGSGPDHRPEDGVPLAPTEVVSVPQPGSADAGDAEHEVTAPTPLPVWQLAAAEPRPTRPVAGRRDPPSVPTATATASGSPPAVRIPPPITLRYALRRGALSGEGELVWQHDGQRYSLDLSARLPLVGVIYEQHSRGGFDAAGLAPVRFTEKRLGKSERAVNFVRPDDGSPSVVAFSSRSHRLPLSEGLQDRLSWMAQLAARLQAWTGEPQVGQRLEIAVAGPSGEIQTWQFAVKEISQAGDERVWRLLREATLAYDTQAEVWVGQRRGQFPLRVRLTEAQGDPLDLTVK